MGNKSVCVSAVLLCLAVTFPLVVVQCQEENTSKFSSLPTTVKAHENDTVLLPCYLENAGSNYHVRWLKDDVLLVDSSVQQRDLLAASSSSSRIQMLANHSLQVVGVLAPDTGEYICEVVRSGPWSPIQQVHAIEVQYPPSVVSVPEYGIVETRLGEDVEIACKASGVPHPIVTWFSKGKEMELLTNREKLKFKATSRHLAGTYECLARNGVGEPARTSIQVVILHPPEVTSDAQWVHTSLGLRAQLECKVVASPHAKVHWFHKTSPVIPDGNVHTHTREDRHLLLFRQVRDSDFGQYTCKAENKIGMNELRLTLSGVANKAVFKTDHSKNHPTKTTYTLIWEVDSYSPVIEYNLWFRPYKPKPPQPDGIFVKENNVTWTKITIPGEKNDGPYHSCSYILKGLMPSMVYEAMITSRNRFGWSKPTEVLHFATDGTVTDLTTTTEKSNDLGMLEEEYIDREMKKNNLTGLHASGNIDNNKISQLKGGASKPITPFWKIATILTIIMLCGL